MYRIILTFALIALFTGCASRWNEKTCSETNFSDLGYQEGSSGSESKLNSYNQACLKKKVQIPTRDYKIGYEKGIKVFCSDNKGLSDGSAGKEIFKNCRSVQAYTKAHKRGLKSYCTTEKGTQDGFSMRSEYILCTSFSAYSQGYERGKKEYCSSERGYEHGFSGQEKDSRCVVYSHYKSGYSKGQRYFCSPENGIKVGESGDDFPEKCESSGSSFKANYKKGRIRFLNKVLREKETAVTFERQNYERIRDELQDSQFELNRLPKYSNDPAVGDERDRVESQIERLQSRRNHQRGVLENLEGDAYNIKKEIRDLKF